MITETKSELVICGSGNSLIVRWMKPGPDYYKYSQKEYLDLIGSSKFGLCLAGYGPKCNREIELIGMGTVPVFAPEVDNTYSRNLS